MCLTPLKRQNLILEICGRKTLTMDMSEIDTGDAQ